MKIQRTPGIKKKIWLVGLLIFAVLSFGAFGGFSVTQSAYAEPENGATEQNTTTTDGAANQNKKANQNDNAGQNNESTDDEDGQESEGGGCKQMLGALGGIVCPVLNTIGRGVDWTLGKIESILQINPVAGATNWLEGVLQIDPTSVQGDSAIHKVWEYVRNITNIVFIGFFLVVIYSQITGYGISNYGIKKSLPKMILVAILINLSYLICVVAIDVSNILGNGLRGAFSSIQEAVLSSNEIPVNEGVTMGEIVKAVVLGGGLAVGGVTIAIEYGLIFMVIPTLLGGLVSVVAGFVTITLRQAVVALLVMISPLAFVAYMLPNTEDWFKRWKKLFTQMLTFYPAFSLLFGASNLASFAIMSTGVANKDAFWIVLALAVRVFPLLYSLKLMKMSGTFLEGINAKLQGLAATPLATNRAWADSHRRNRFANTVANGISPSAALIRRLDERRTLREKDTENAQKAIASRSELYAHRKIAGSEIGDMTSKVRRTSRYTRNEKAARNYDLRTKNAASHTDHVMGNYGNYFSNGARDRKLDDDAKQAWKDFGRAVYQKEFDDENDINWLVDQYLEANKRDENNRPLDEVAFNRYVKSVVSGPHGEERLLGKIIKQASVVETKQKSEMAIMEAKYGHNGYNKKAFREWLVGYKINDDGWAIDQNGERLKDDDGNDIEVVQGDAITKAPEKLVLYDKRDAHGIYFDMKDQDNNIVARIYRGRGLDGRNHDDASYIKEMLSNWDIPISDPINNVYGILSGIKPGSIVTPQGQNEIGLARYSTTIARALNNYKGDASWSGAMFNTGVGNRQIHNSAQYAIWVLDSIKKTLKPGSFNTQNPASVKYLASILNPDNWEKIFTEEEIMNAVNINNELFGGENWLLNDDGTVMKDENGDIQYEKVENPNYTQRMNTIKRKLIFPALEKILPAFERLRTSNTAENQKPGTADEEFDLLEMVEKKYTNSRELPFDPTLVDQDLQLLVRDFRRRKHDKDGNLIYTNPEGGERGRNLYNALEDIYVNSVSVEDLKSKMVTKLSSHRMYERALQQFEELWQENPGATMEQVRGWFVELDSLVID